MAANEIHVDDIGTKFIVTIKDGTSVVNISAATTKEILFKKPSGIKLTKAAAFETDGTDGVISYTTIDTELDETGTYKIQAHVVLSVGNEFHSDISTFKVHRNVTEL